MKNAKGRKKIIQELISFFQEIGYKYITRQEASDFRGGDIDLAILKNVFISQVRAINHFQYKGETIGFSDENILAGFLALKNEALKEESETRNKKVYDTLMVGKTFEESIHTDKKSFLLKYIDWENFNNNSFHITDEFEMLRNGSKIRLDLVLFVNGIPLVIIEANNEIWKAQEQQERMSRSFFMPHQYAQILLAVDPSQMLYSIAGNFTTHWHRWRTDPSDEFFGDERIKQLEAADMELYQQIYPLTRPDRLLDLIKYFIFYDARKKKIARYYQYYAVKKTISGIAEQNKRGLNKRGIIVQPNGTGKLRTMFLLSDYIFRSKKSPHTRILLIVNNIETFYQVSDMFSRNNPEIGKAKTSEELYSLLKSPYVPIVISTIHKFNYLFDDKWAMSNTDDFFILIEEVQRGYTGILGHKLLRFFSNATVIGFTGFPVSEKVLSGFQSVINQYTFQEAVNDGNLLDLIYDHRSIDIEISGKGGDSRLGENPVLIERIADDILNHYKSHWETRQAKAVLVTPSVYAATLYKQYFDKTSIAGWQINAATYVSGRSAYSTEMVERWEILRKFNDPSDEVQILIVVNALETGIQINPSILYVAKPLNKRALISSISPIMRLSGIEKVHGLIVDYVGIYEELNELFKESVLPVYNKDQSRQLSFRYDQLEHLFPEKFNVEDEEKLQPYIRSDQDRSLFLERLSLFEKSLLLTQSSRDEIAQYSEAEMDFYKKKLMFFRNLKELITKYKTDKNEELIKHLQTLGKDDENISTTSVAEPSQAYRTPKDFIYQALKTILKKHRLVIDENVLLEFSNHIEEGIQNNAVRDWKINVMAINKMKNNIDDILFKFGKEQAISFNYDIIDELLSSIILIAKLHY